VFVVFPLLIASLGILRLSREEGMVSVGLAGSDRIQWVRIRYNSPVSGRRSEALWIDADEPDSFESVTLASLSRGGNEDADEDDPVEDSAEDEDEEDAAASEDREGIVRRREGSHREGSAIEAAAAAAVKDGFDPLLLGDDGSGLAAAAGEGGEDGALDGESADAPDAPKAAAAAGGAASAPRGKGPGSVRGNKKASAAPKKPKRVYGIIGKVPVPPLEPIPEGDPRLFANTTECDFSRCNEEPGKHILGNHVESSKLPFMFVVVPFRNRLDNLARLLSSINNGTTPQQRACTCIVISDFATSSSALPPWKNASCVATMHAAHKIYFDPADDNTAPFAGAAAHRIKENGGLKGTASWSMAVESCPSSALRPMVLPKAGKGSGPRKPVKRVRLDASPSPTPSASPTPSPSPSPQDAPLPFDLDSVVPDRLRLLPGFTVPLHVDVSGLSGQLSVRHVLSLYDGPSKILDALAYVGQPKVKFSRAGGIQAGIDSITTPAHKSLVFVCDADMILRPGFYEDFISRPVAGAAVYYPICWSTCWGQGLETVPTRTVFPDSTRGFWRSGGHGMLVAYLVDLRRVGGMVEQVTRGQWGGEDNMLHSKFVKSYSYRMLHKKCPYLVHAYHSQVRDWNKSEDGMYGSYLGPFGRHVCTPLGRCQCPKGTSAAEITIKVREYMNMSSIDLTRRIKSNT
jgi:hypothetical protein